MSPRNEMAPRLVKVVGAGTTIGPEKASSVGTGNSLDPDRFQLRTSNCLATFAHVGVSNGSCAMMKPVEWVPTTTGVVALKVGAASWPAGCKSCREVATEFVAVAAADKCHVPRLGSEGHGRDSRASQRGLSLYAKYLTPTKGHVASSSSLDALKVGQCRGER